MIGIWRIKKEFENYFHPRGMGMVYLNPDKALTPFDITYPIAWTGTVGGKEVRIIQHGQSASSMEDFDFKDFPDQFSYLKSSIISWIHEALRILN